MPIKPQARTPPSRMKTSHYPRLPRNDAQILEMIPPPDANLSTIFAVTDAAYAAIDSDTTMAAFRAGNASGLDLASLEARLPLPKAASMWLFRSLQRPYSLDDLRGLTSVPTALAAATGDARYRLYFTPINLRGSVRSVVIDDLLSAFVGDGREGEREENGMGLAFGFFFFCARSPLALPLSALPPKMHSDRLRYACRRLRPGKRRDEGN